MAEIRETVARQRAKAALKNLFIADALAMPVHWYYRVSDIFDAFPDGVTAYEAPPSWHPSSIMSLHSTVSGGRKSGTAGGRDVVGDLILQGRRSFWDQQNVHYHVGMAPGENTLNAHCARVLMRTLAADGGEYDAGHYLAEYVAFMTSNPPLHPDTYAESYHRAFFQNFAHGLAPEVCAAVTHDTPSVGGLVTIAPIVLSSRLNGVPLEEVKALCRTHLFLTHPSEELAVICDIYVTLMDRLLFRADGQDPSTAELMTFVPSRHRKAVANACTSQIPDSEVVGRLLSPACYISDAWPAVLYFLCRYRGEPDKAMLANTHVGGDNVHRGAVLGVLAGLLAGECNEVWFEKLVEEKRVSAEIEGIIG